MMAKARRKYCTIGYSCTDSLPDAQVFIDAALAHTGVPDEGDYLKSNCYVTSLDCFSEASENVTYATYQFEASYRTTLQQETLMDIAVGEVLKQIRRDNAYTAIVDICAYIEENVFYDHYFVDIEDLPLGVINHPSEYNILKHTAYGALVNKTAVCEGFSALFYRLALECGIDSRMIYGAYGASGIPHAWNIADITGSGGYYFFDCTNRMHFLGNAFMKEAERACLYGRNAEYKTESFLKAYPLVEDDYCTPVNYTFDSDSGTLYINGSGVLEDIFPYGIGHGTGDYEDSMANDPYYTSTCPWTADFRNAVVSVIVADGITRIGDRLFEGFSNLQSVSLPNSLKEIGNNVFYGCSLLEEVDIPSGVEYIGDYAFALSALVRISLPEGLSQTGIGLFYGCEYLQTAELPDGLTRIENEMFYQCIDLESVHISAGTTFIGDSAFERCLQLCDLTLPEGITYIGNNAFNDCCRLNVSIPSSVRIIGDGAFIHCESMLSAKIPEGTAIIGDQAFYFCLNLKSVIIPEGVVEIGDEAFRYCGLTSISIPEGVTTIGDRAFSGTSVRTISIPASLTDVGEAVFGGCQFIENFDVAPDNPILCSVDGVLFNKDCTELLIFTNGKTLDSYTVPDTVQTIAPDAFACAVVSEVIIPDGITSIPDYAFLYSDIMSISLPNSLRYIGNHAFNYCDLLKSLVIPEGVIEIGEQAFFRCERLESLSIPQSLINIPVNAFRECRWVSSITLAEGNPAYKLEDGVLYTADGSTIVLFPSDEEHASFTIPDSVTSIDASAFYNRYYLTSITIPDSVLSIGMNAFNQCGYLKEAIIGRRITEIPKNAFYLCNRLETVAIPSSVTKISAGAFSACYSLSKVYYSGTAEKWNAIEIDANNESLNNAEVIFENIYEGEAPEIPEQIDTNIITVTFDAGEGTVDITQKEVDTKGSYGELPIPEREGYTFCGWSLNPDSEEIITQTALVDVKEDHTLYALWDDLAIISGSCGQTVAWKLYEDGTLKVYGKGATVAYPSNESFPWYAYRLSVQTLEIGEGIDTIGQAAFWGFLNLTEVVFPDSLVTIQDSAFGNCPRLTELAFPEGLKHIEKYAFTACAGLQKVTFPKSLIEVGKQAFSVCTGLKTIVFSGGNIVLNGFAFARCTSLTDVDLRGVVELGDSAFAMCSSLQTISIPGTVLRMGNDVFTDCSKLQQVVFCEGVAQIGHNIFRNCEMLTSVTIPNSVWELTDSLFSGLDSLREVRLSNVLQKIPTRFFAESQKMETVTIPESVTAISSFAFYGCSGLTEIQIPFNVKEIGNGAFYGCGGLESITLYPSLTAIADNAFAGCGKLSVVQWHGTEDEWNAVNIGQNNEAILNAQLVLN